MSYEKIPEELKVLPQWVCFKFSDRGNGKRGKVPVNPKTGENAKANDPTTWGTFSEALTGVELYDLDGIGIEFGNGIFGIDLDGVIDQSGNLSPEALDIVRTMDSYTEFSPSGSGLHILARGSIPGGDRRKGAIEIYDSGRFFTVTGKIYGEPRELAERTQEAAIVHSKYIYRLEDKKPVEGTGEVVSVDLSDTELLDKMFNSKRGAQIRRLWSGDLSDYSGDHSAADFALVRDLAYWTNGDAARIDHLFRASGLMRDKWNRRQSGTTYGAITIGRILRDFTAYRKTEPIKKITSGDRVLYDRDAPDPVKPQASTQAPQVKAPEKMQSVADYLRKNFVADRSQFKGYKQRKTGFSNLDDKTGGLYPGLYVIGAQSSLGKTTFAHQIGDQLAASGDKVLYFSLEQSTFELVTKSLARESFKQDENENGALTAIELRSGGSSEKVKAGYKNYMTYSENMIIKECNFSESIESIEQTVKDYIAATGVKPVVFIDYLQIIPATDPRMSDKEKIDQNIKRLKILQRNNDLVLFVISALNRANYMTQISFESFKESGAIEYTADVIWGMQYSILSTNPIFKSAAQGKLNEQRKAIQEAKQRTPRQIELVCLKNRYGRDYSAYFLYNPKYDYFMVDNSTEKQNSGTATSQFAKVRI